MWNAAQLDWAEFEHNLTRVPGWMSAPTATKNQVEHLKHNFHLKTTHFVSAFTSLYINSKKGVKPCTEDKHTILSQVIPI